MDLISKPEKISAPRPLSSADVQREINDQGFYNAANVIPASVCEQVLQDIARLLQSEYAVKHGTDTYALRNILNAVPSVREAAHHRALADLIHTILGEAGQPVRAILFDKTDKVNWNLVWHQDLTIAVKEKRETAGFGPWSIKNGIHHVQPPIEVMEKMVAARIHLDDCGIENGALRVLPSTHNKGRLEPQQIEEYRQSQSEVVCAAKTGDVLFMRPLLLHCSRKATRPEHRRVLHIEFTAGELPNGLDWSQ